ncbi:MAG: hypothetical protein J6C20_10615 [Paludibacteraceae bacterium]|nr:hypothetical protein [Paludibacteraceae bacterium]
MIRTVGVRKIVYPYGEIFIEERNNSFTINYLFNAKELDNETGLYYYGEGIQTLRKRCG